MHLRRSIPLLLASGLLFVGCSGSGGGSGASAPAPTQATRLVYTDPAGTGWRLVRNAASTPTHLVLDLMPPAGTSGRGVALTLSCNGAIAKWERPEASGTRLLKPGPVYNLGGGAPAILGLAKGSSLQVGLYQKGRGASAAYDGTKPLLSVALDLVPGAPLNADTATNLRLDKAQHLGAAAGMVDLRTSVAMGTLSVQ